ncbi:MAG: ATP-binding cassette domain-containing protein [Clostridium sp.]|uniref:ATP-binding cassette domain-containing protein n=1 Tax=Clostridium sp. TaxID=1506 RepID=UPI0025BD5E68|nr:ATP-binding cassette domain-containing protein [Clostridium sp.]MBS5927722.1 ATP-binding cassette domain-containing protein [Clostridium sp.]
MLEIKEVYKTYGKKVALDNISIKLDYGVYGLLGPNGAGKSTLMNIITDNIDMDKGEILYNGNNVKSLGKDFLKDIGFAPQQQGLYEEFTGRRFLAYMGTLKGISKKILKEEIERVAKDVNLLNELDKKIGGYSGGMKQRILIAQAIMGSPKILIMDEPTAGLDPKERVRVRELLFSISKEKIILVATHVVSDIQSISKEIIIIKDGKIVEVGTSEKLIDKYAANGNLEDVYMKIFDGGK